jgi:hypothetical protein
MTKMRFPALPATVAPDRLRADERRGRSRFTAVNTKSTLRRVHRGFDTRDLNLSKKLLDELQLQWA